LTLSAIGVVCALAAEARHLKIATSRPDRLALLADGSLLAISGMGAESAARGARALVAAGARALASFGLAGGLDPALAAGDIFLPSEVTAETGPAIATADHWRARLVEALAAHRPRSQGRLLSSAGAIGSVEQKADCFRRTGAAAVDMESLAIAQVAAADQLPFVAVRVIVDAAGDALPRAVTAAADGAGHLRIWRLMGALARSPADLPPLLRLARRYRAASRSLSAVARAGAFSARASS
jgi:adenosylhomocysteine nucleosidase